MSGRRTTAQLRPIFSTPQRHRPAFTNDYHPTEQNSGIHRLCRGNPPRGLTDKEWERAFNNADSKLRRSRKLSTRRAEAARLSGEVRKLAIEMLKQGGMLRIDYVDRDI